MKVTLIENQKVERDIEITLPLYFKVSLDTDYYNHENYVHITENQAVLLEKKVGLNTTSYEIERRTLYLKGHNGSHTLGILLRDVGFEEDTLITEEVFEKVKAEFIDYLIQCNFYRQG